MIAIATAEMYIHDYFLTRLSQLTVHASDDMAHVISIHIPRALSNVINLTNCLLHTQPISNAETAARGLFLCPGLHLLFPPPNEHKSDSRKQVRP